MIDNRSCNAESFSESYEREVYTCEKAFLEAS